MLKSISNTVKGLSFEGPFSKIAVELSYSSKMKLSDSSGASSSPSRKPLDTQTTRTDSSFSNDATLSSSMRNHDLQPLHYKKRKRTSPMASAAISNDVKKHKRMSALKDRRILRPDRKTEVRTSTRRSTLLD